MVPSLAILSHAGEAFPETPAGTLINDFVQSVDYRRVFGRPVCLGFVQRRPRETHDLASFASGELMVYDHQLNHSALGCRR
jgi:hypothetical protein